MQPKMSSAPNSHTADESEPYATAEEVLADLERGDYLYLTPRMCKSLAAIVRAALRSETGTPFCWYTTTCTITDEYETVYSEDGDKPEGGGDWKPLYTAPVAPTPNTTKESK